MSRTMHSSTRRQCPCGAILALVDPRDSAAELEKTIERYNDAWNAHDVGDDPVVPRARDGVREPHGRRSRRGRRRRPTHRGDLRARTPDLTFAGRRLYARDGLVVSEWTATATNRAGQRVEWDGIDVFPFENGLILRKDVYSSSHRPRVLDA